MLPASTVWRSRWYVSAALQRVDRLRNRRPRCLIEQARGPIAMPVRDAELAAIAASAIVGELDAAGDAAETR